jgi:hypothetical protein
MLFLHLVIHEIQVVKSTKYTFGFGDSLDTFFLGGMPSRIGQRIKKKCSTLLECL